MEHARIRPGEHLLVDLVGREPGGPTVIVSGGLHGNEPAGVAAALEVARRLRAEGGPRRGRLIVMAGNTRALPRGERYLDRDLNRGWNEGNVARLLATDAARLSCSEDRETVEIVRLLDPLMRAARRPLVLLDLHSTSGSSAPFVAMADVLRNRPSAFALGLPVILGLEEAIPGALLGWFCDAGHVALAVEGGRHDDPDTVSALAAAARRVLDVQGLHTRGEDEKRADDERLRAASRHLPSVLEIRHREVIPPETHFEMRPGFTSFQPVARSTLLAHRDGREIRAGEEALLLMPRYQPQGEDGFFLARPVRRFWLRLSALLRRLRLDALVPWLPGVRTDPEDGRRVLVDPRVARWFTTEILHLFGFRRGPGGGAERIYHRRTPDHRAR